MSILPAPSVLSLCGIAVASAHMPINNCFFVIILCGYECKPHWLPEVNYLGAHSLNGSCKIWTLYVYSFFPDILRYFPEVLVTWFYCWNELEGEDRKVPTHSPGLRRITSSTV